MEYSTKYRFVLMNRNFHSGLLTEFCLQVMEIKSMGILQKKKQKKRKNKIASDYGSTWHSGDHYASKKAKLMQNREIVSLFFGV